MSKGHELHLVFGILGNATGLFLILAPVVTFKRIINKKSTEMFSGVPYVMSLLNCLLSTWYGLPFITNNNYLLSAINGFGVVIESIYVVIFLIYAPKKTKLKIMGLVVAILSVFLTIALVSSIALHKKNERQLFCGMATSIFSIVMYASPLSVMMTVIKTRSVQYMPFLLSLFVFFSSTFWTIYGFVGRDKFIYISAGLGSLLGMMQLIIHAVYRNNKGAIEKSNMDSVVELGVAKPETNTQEAFSSSPQP